MRIAVLVLVVASIGLPCGGQMNTFEPPHASSAGPANVVPNGVWGGDHIRMEITEVGADIEFDCARGAISQRLEMDAQGRFKLRGTYKAETPAPAAVEGGSPASGVSATYSGVLSGSSLRLEVLIDGQDTPKTFVLEQGDQGRLAKCA